MVSLKTAPKQRYCINEFNLLTTVSIKNRSDANSYTCRVMFIVIKLF